MRISSAQARTKRVSRSWGCSIFAVNFCLKWLLWHVHVHFDWADSCKTRNLAQTSYQETSCRDLVQRSCQETSYGDLVRRYCQETSSRDLANRALTEILYRDLAGRPLLEILLRDLVKRAEILLKDLAQRSCIESLNRDLTFEIPHTDLLWRSLKERSLQESFQETSYRDLVQRSCQDTSYGDVVQRHCIEICCRDFAKGSLT